MAERVGFEPTLPFRVNTLSKRAPSATRPSLRRESDGRNDSCGSLRSAAKSQRSHDYIVLFNSMGQVVEPQLERKSATGSDPSQESFPGKSVLAAGAELEAGGALEPEAPAAAAFAAPPFTTGAGSGGTF